MIHEFGYVRFLIHLNTSAEDIRMWDVRIPSKRVRLRCEHVACMVPVGTSRRSLEGSGIVSYDDSDCSVKILERM